MDAISQLKTMNADFTLEILYVFEKKACTDYVIFRRYADDLVHIDGE